MKRIANTISIIELSSMFGTERKAVAWLERSRWEGKPVCPHCGGMDNIKPYKGKKFTYWHKDCRKAFTVKTGSVMHASKIGIRKWAIAIYAVLTARKGISSLQLSKELGITQKSSWYMLQRIREACKQGEFKLSHIVEVDEAYIGGMERNKHENKKLKAGRGTIGKIPVLGMRERKGRVKAMPVGNTDKHTLQNVIYDNIEKGSRVFTDEHGAYTGLQGYTHEAINHSANRYVDGMVHTNSIESVWALLKRGVHGTFHHVSKKHLHRYVDEFAFRLNEGNCEVDTIDRMESLVQGMGGKRISYKELTT